MSRDSGSMPTADGQPAAAIDVPVDPQPTRSTCNELQHKLEQAIPIPFHPGPPMPCAVLSGPSSFIRQKMHSLHKREQNESCRFREEPTVGMHAFACLRASPCRHATRAQISLVFSALQPSVGRCDAARAPHVQHGPADVLAGIVVATATPRVRCMHARRPRLRSLRTRNGTGTVHRTALLCVGPTRSS